MRLGRLSVSTNTGSVACENDKATLLCHAKPSLGNLLLVIIGVCLGIVFVWAYLGLPASAAVREYILGLLVLALGAFLVCGGIAYVVGAIFGYPRLKLDSNHLIFVGILGRSLTLNLGELGKATVFQSGRGTWLAFFTLREERALTATGDLPKPNGSNAAKYVPLFPFIGNNFQRAQELADRINATRCNSASREVDASDPEAAIKTIEQRGRRRISMFVMAILAISIFAILI